MPDKTVDMIKRRRRRLRTAMISVLVQKIVCYGFDVCDMYGMQQTPRAAIVLLKYALARLSPWATVPADTSPVLKKDVWSYASSVTTHVRQY